VDLIDVGLSLGKHWQSRPVFSTQSLKIRFEGGGTGETRMIEWSDDGILLVPVHFLFQALVYREKIAEQCHVGTEVQSFGQELPHDATAFGLGVVLLGLMTQTGGEGLGHGLS
jgi:hypothetical protein